MPNHFHFLIKIKNFKQLEIPEDYPYDSHKFVMQQWSNFLNSYTKAFNKKYGRMGSLFVNQVRRSYIDSEDYLNRTIHYIHENPVKHRFRIKSEEWFYSSLHHYRHPKDNGLLANNSKNLIKNAVAYGNQFCLEAFEFLDCT